MRATPPPSPRAVEPALIGRETELETLAALLAAEGSLVSLLGCPGVGTSRLGREVTRTSFQRTLTVAATELATVRAADVEGLELLMVDDVDGDARPVAKVLEPLRRRAPQLRVLAVGDEPLELAAEQVLVLDVLREDAAVELYRARTPEAQREAIVENDVRDLVRRLCGLPLAVELAGHQAGTIAARDLANARGAVVLARLRTHRPHEPHGGEPSPRRTSLRKTFDVVWDALGEGEQAALVAVAAFVVPPRLDDVDAMQGCAATEDAFEAVETLLRRQLLRRAHAPLADSRRGHTRLALAPLLAEYLVERTAGEARFANVAERHAAVLQAQVEAVEPRLYGPAANDALEELRTRLPDVRAACIRIGPALPALAARLVLPFVELAIFGSGLATDDELLAEALAFAEASGERLLRVRARQVRARMLLEQNEPAAAAGLLAEMAELLQPEDDALSADGDRIRGWAALAMLDLDAAERHFEHALAEHRRQRATRGQADACAGVAMVARFRGDEAGALRLLESAHGIHVVSSDVIREAKVREMARLVGLELPGRVSEELTTGELRARADEHRANGRPWRDALCRLALARKLTHDGDRVQGRAMMTEARASAELAGGRPEWIAALEAQAATEERTAWRICADGSEAIAPEGKRVDLRTRPVLRRIFAALVAARVAAEGRALDVEQILAAGWPGERVQHGAGLLRVYTAIKRLRALGLQSLVCTVEEGYLLTSAVPVTLVSGPLET